MVTPDDYDNDKFVIVKLHEILFSNPNNYSTIGNGRNARYCWVIEGLQKHIFDNNYFDLRKYYSEYDWNKALADYPKDTETYDNVQNLLKEEKLQVMLNIRVFVLQARFFR